MGTNRQTERKPGGRLRASLWVLTAALLLSGAVGLGLLQTAIGFLGQIERASSRCLRLAELHGEILRLDEVLTMSARMAAAGGGEDWERRYRAHEPRLDAALAEAVALAHDAEIRRAARLTGEANRLLVAMEHRAFALVRDGWRGEAQSLLSGSDYEEQKQRYAAGMVDLMSMLRAHLRADLETHQKRLAAVVLAMFAVLFVTGWAWFKLQYRVELWRLALATTLDDPRRGLREAHAGLQVNVPVDALTAAACRVAAALALVVAGTGLAVLVGWWLDVEILKAVVPGFVAMKPNTALCLVLAGGALWLQRHEPPRSGRLRWAGRAAGLAVAGAGWLTLVQWLLGADLGIDQLLFAEPPGAAGTVEPGRMAPTTAACFALSGAALFLLDRGPGHRGYTAQVFALAAALPPALALIGYLYGSEAFIGLPASTQMALHTAAALLLLDGAILLARPERGVLATLTGSGVGGALLRNTLLPAVLIPLVFGWLRLLGQRAGIYGTEFGLSVMVAFVIGSFLAQLWWTAASLQAADNRRLRAEAALQESEQRFRATFEQAAVGISLVAPEGRWLQVNGKLCEITGYERDELLALSFQQITHPDDLDADLDLVRQMLAGEIATYTLEKRYCRKDGSTVWINLTVSLVHEADGAPKYFIAVIEDIARRRAAEEEIRALNAELEERVRERTAQLEAANRELESFSYSVSHDLRAPLRHLDGFARLLLRDAGNLGEKAGRYVRIISESAGKMGALIDDLLAFSRTGRAELRQEEVDMAQLVGEVRHQLTPTTAGRDIEWRIGPLPPARGDLALLRLVWANLLDNAIKYTGTRKRARIEIGCAGDPHAATHTYFVRDNGVGFDPQYAHKLFGVFQRLHREDEFPGTGIGLATTQRIVHRHGGHVWAYGQPDQGAVVSFALPAATREET